MCDTEVVVIHQEDSEILGVVRQNRRPFVGDVMQIDPEDSGYEVLEVERKTENRYEVRVC